jgi:hypothetical protein
VEKLTLNLSHLNRLPRRLMAQQALHLQYPLRLRAASAQSENTLHSQLSHHSWQEELLVPCLELLLLLWNVSKFSTKFRVPVALRINCQCPKHSRRYGEKKDFGV